MSHSKRSEELKATAMNLLDWLEPRVPKGLSFAVVIDEGPEGIAAYASSAGCEKFIETVRRFFPEHKRAGRAPCELSTIESLRSLRGTMTMHELVALLGIQWPTIDRAMHGRDVNPGTRALIVEKLKARGER